MQPAAVGFWRGIAAGLLVAALLIPGGPVEGGGADVPRSAPSVRQHFQVDCSMKVDRHGRAVASGYVQNQSPRPVKRVDLVVESLDAQGQTVAHRVEFLGVIPAADGRVYYETRVPAPSPACRASVLEVDWFR